MSERLHRLRPDELTPEQAAVREAITGGPRGDGPQAFPLTADDGSLHGPFGIMLHAPSIGAALQEVGAAVRYRTSLSARVREIAVLQVAAATASSFERWAHERVGRRAGLTDPEMAQLARGRRLELADPQEQAAHDFVAAVLHDPHVPTPAYRAAADALGPGTLVELTVLVGYYRLLADTMHVFDVQAPDVQAPDDQAPDDQAPDDQAPDDPA